MPSKQDPQSSETTDSAGAPRGGRFKTFLLAGGLLIGEAVLLLGGYHYVAGPQSVSAESDEQIVEAPERRITELQLINERLTNNRMGAVYVYPVEIYVQVNEPDSAWWTELTDQYQNEIRAEIAISPSAGVQGVLRGARQDARHRRVRARRLAGLGQPSASPRHRNHVSFSHTGSVARSITCCTS